MTRPLPQHSAHDRNADSIQRLSGDWRLARDPRNAGRGQKWFKGVQKAAKKAPVPGIIQQVFPDYHGVAWYWHSFQVARDARRAQPAERYLLRFGAVDYLAEVWLNGKPVGGHEGGETPFTLDVTAAVKPRGQNLLAVRVLNPTDEPIDGIRLVDTPHRNKFVKDYQPGRSYNYGGILLPAELLVVPAVRIADVCVRPRIETGKIDVAVTVCNDSGAAAKGRLTASVGTALAGETLSGTEAQAPFAAGRTVHQFQLSVTQPRLWNPDDPFLYQVTIRLEATGRDRTPFRHETAVRCGFRDFRVVDGYYRLNGKRIFLKSTHTGNHFPMGQVVPQNPDFLRRDLLYAKSVGFNMVRFIAGVAWPEQLDFCDELGLMVYEECLAGWLLGDSPKMAERYEGNVREMVLRDRNHPSVTIWGMLNETSDGPVFRQAVKALSLVRSLDDSRLVLLNSGRWDCQPSIGSASNPGSGDWEHVWGIEAPGAPPVSKDWNREHGGYFDRAGDAHVYPAVPHPTNTLRFIRNLGRTTKPVFLSEYGIGSLPHTIREWRKYEQLGARPDLPDLALWRSMSEKLAAEWQRYGMADVYPFLEDFLSESQRLHARQRLLGFDLIRSNPSICGFNLTGILDHGITGEGLWTFWREWKPAVYDAVADGWSPLRWCLFVEPTHGYLGRPFTVEAALANEDVLPPGNYPACFRISGPESVGWEKRVQVRLPKPKAGKDAPLAVPVLGEEVLIQGPPGVYELAANLEQGGAPAGGRLKFHVSDASALPAIQGSVTLWGIAEPVERWLQSHGLQTCRFAAGSPPCGREVILVGDVSGLNPDLAAWQELAARIARGSTAVFLSANAFKRGDNAVGWLPLARKGRCTLFWDWLYHKECVARRHPVFDGLQAKGIMDWDYYGPVITRQMFDGQDTPDDVAAAAFAVGYCCLGGVASGLLVGAYRAGAGRFVLNTLRILENVGTHPASDRLLLNLVRYGQEGTCAPLAPLPANYKTWLAEIGYR